MSERSSIHVFILFPLCLAFRSMEALERFVRALPGEWIAGSDEFHTPRVWPAPLRPVLIHRVWIRHRSKKKGEAQESRQETS